MLSTYVLCVFAPQLLPLFATKTKALLTWLNVRRYDIIFLQETYSTAYVEDIWRTKWRGKLFFAHGSNHSSGVIILVRSDLGSDLGF